MPRRSPAPVIGVLLALGAAGLVVGTVVVEDPSVVLPVILGTVVLGLLTAAIVVREPDLRIRRSLGHLLLAALVLRAGAMFVVYVVLDPAFFAPDTIGYGAIGEALANHWRGIGPSPIRPGTRTQPYIYVNAFFALLFGRPAMSAAVLNAFAGAWTCVATFYLGRRLMSEQVGWVAGWLVAAFPSMVLWSVLNIRDAITTLVVVAVVHVAVLVVQARRTRLVVAFGAMVFLLWGLRDYMAFLVVAGTALGAFASARPGRVGRSLAFGLIFVIGAAFLAEQGGLLNKVQEGDVLGSIQTIRQGMTVGAGSAFGGALDTSTIAGAIRYVPLGMMIILLAPFPWAITSALQAFTLPEVLAWYILLPFAFPGIKLAFKEGARTQLVALSVILVVIATYSLVEGNLGTAYRHRAQILPLAFLYVSTGLILWHKRFWGGRSGRRRQARKGAQSPSSSGAPVR